VVEQGALVVVVEFGGFGDAGFEEVGGGVERPAGLVVEDEVVEAGVECFSDAGESVEAGRDAAVLMAADLASVAADAFGELGLGPAVLVAWCLDSFAEWHQVASEGGLWPPFCADLLL